MSSRKDRSKTQNLYVIEARNNGLYEKKYIVMGSTGNVYTVTIGPHPTCTCPDYRNRHARCKHIYFIMLRIMKINKGEDKPKYSPAELIDMFRNIPKEVEHLYVDADTYKKYDQMKNQESGNVQMKSIEDDLCPICLDDLTNGEDIEYCKTRCGKAIHRECFKMWSRGREKACMFCRSPWDTVSTAYINLK